MRISKTDKQRLKHFLYNQLDRIEAIINDYGADAADIADLEMIKRVSEALEKDLIQKQRRQK